MTSMRKRLEQGDPRFARAWLETGQVFCCLKVFVKNGKKHFQCDHLPEPLSYPKFIAACTKCKQEMKEMLTPELKVEVSTWPRKKK